MDRHGVPAWRAGKLAPDGAVQPQVASKPEPLASRLLQPTASEPHSEGQVPGQLGLQRT
jgi:hypothetical protein